MFVVFIAVMLTIFVPYDNLTDPMRATSDNNFWALSNSAIDAYPLKVTRVESFTISPIHSEEGKEVGMAVGIDVGVWDGCNVGGAVGGNVGSELGRGVGRSVGR